jgi:hypothetical protein
MVKVNYDATTGKIKGFFPDTETYSSIPDPNIEIDEATHLDCINNPGLRKVDIATLEIITCTLPETTTDEKIAALDAEYESQFTSLSQAYSTALMAGDTTTAADVQADYATLKSEYTEKLGAIE